jgi:hypothetical protein
MAAPAAISDPSTLRAPNTVFGAGARARLQSGIEGHGATLGPRFEWRVEVASAFVSFAVDGVEAGAEAGAGQRQ